MARLNETLDGCPTSLNERLSKANNSKKQEFMFLFLPHNYIKIKVLLLLNLVVIIILY